MTKLRVLIVDDEQMIADSLCLIFERRGFETQAAYSGQDALNRAKTFHPQLLLTDLTMPGMGGLVMASMMVHELPACRVLLLTGDYHALEQVWTTGNTLFRSHAILTKPIHPETLLREAHDLLHSGMQDSPVMSRLQ